MDTITIFALIISSLALTKILVILVKPKAWLNLVKGIWKAPALMMIVCLILAAIVFYYLIQSITIVQIMATMLFLALLYGMTFAVHSKETLVWAQKMLNDRKFMRRVWLPVLIWLVLVLWALKEILL